MIHFRGLCSRKLLQNYVHRPLNTTIKRRLRGVTKDSNGKDFSRPFVEELEIGQTPKGWGTLIKPTVFTVAFSASAFGLASIWQYENMRFDVLQKKLQNPVKSFWNSIIKDHPEEIPPPANKILSWRTEINKWWNTKLTDGQKVFVPICAINILVYGMWFVPSLRPVMKKYFCSSPTSAATCWPMLLSAFSHYSFFHLAANMFVLHSFSTSMVSILGKEQFVALYTSSAVFSSYCSHAFKILSGRMALSLGASGAICTILGVFGTLVPDAKLQIVFLPFIQFSAASALKGMIAIDTLGLIARWHFFDHAAHLGGMLLGIWYCHYGYKLIWEKREPIMSWWHKNVRQRPS